jgi:hypothetical protein
MKRRICCRSTHNITIPGCRFDGVGLSREDAALPAMQLKDDPPVCCQDDNKQHACSKAPRRIYNCRKKRIKAVRSSSKPSLRVVSRRPASRDLKKNEHKKKSRYSSTLPIPRPPDRGTQGIRVCHPRAPNEEARDILFDILVLPFPLLLGHL